MRMTHLSRRGLALTATAVAALGLSASAAQATFVPLPSGAKVNDDPAAGIDPTKNAGVADVVGGSLAAGGIRVPWATFEQETAGEQQIFVRAFKNNVWTTFGSPASLNIEADQEAEEPSIDFAGPNRTVPWVSWYEPNSHLSGGGPTNIFASRFSQATNKWIPDGQDRAPADKVPSLNIHTDRTAENPALVGGAATAGNAPSPWVAWQERDGGGTDATSPFQIFVSRSLLQTDCSAVKPGGGTSVAAFCWQQTGVKRILKNSTSTLAPTDPTLNIDPTRDGIEPDFAFTGPSDTVPWVVWYEEGPSKIGLRNNAMVFAAKGIKDAAAEGGFRWVTVGRGSTGAGSPLDTSGTKRFGPCAESVNAENACSLSRLASKDAEHPRVAAGTVTPGKATIPWVVWDEELENGNHGIFAAFLSGDHFALANGGNSLSDPAVNATRPDITFSGPTPYVSWHAESGANRKTVVGHFKGVSTFVVDTQPTLSSNDIDVRSPLSSGCTADPFTADGATCPGGGIGTPFVLHTTDAAPQSLLAAGYRPVGVSTGAASAISSTGATLNGSVNPQGAAVKARFDFGFTTAYGNSTASVRVSPNSVPTGFNLPVTGQPPGQLIHYRAVIQTDFGTLVGPDRTFTTL